MTESSEPPPIVRVLVALDPSPYGLAALDAAVQWAAELQAELQGLFVEDVNLVRVSQLPFAREVTGSAAPRPLDPAAVLRALRDKAERSRQAFDAAVRRLSLRSSFDVARGSVVASALAAAADVDLLIVGIESRSWRFALAPAAPRARPRAQPVAVVYDGSPAAQRMLSTVAQLARAAEGPVAVLPQTPDPQQAAALGKEAEDRLHGLGAPTTRVERCVRDAADLVAVAKRCGPRMLLLNRDNALVNRDCLERLVDQLDCPVTLVR